MNNLFAAIPSPSQGVWYIGAIPIRAYGLLMVLAMVVAIWIAYARYRARGGESDVVFDAAIWAIPFGIVGGRLYHVITSPTAYFGPGGDPMAAFRIWQGGMGIWGAVALGALGAWIGLRRDKQRMGPFADSLAPGLLVAQFVGRWGNYFNQELFGRPTTLPWGLEIDAAHLPPGYAEGTLFHPTFLYEGLWNLAMAALIVILDRKIRFKSGQVISLYFILYGIGRFWVEMLRIDDAHHVLGLRLNDWTALFVIALGVVLFWISGRIGADTRVTKKERLAFEELAKSRKAKGGEGNVEDSTSKE